MVKNSISSIGISFAIIFFFMGCNDKIKPGTTNETTASSIKTLVSVAAISNQPFVYEALGTITAQEGSTLSSKIMGEVKAINVKEGNLVKQGDILVVLDKRQVDVGLRQSEAGLSEARKAKAALAQAKDGVAAAQSRIQQAEATVSGAGFSRKDATITAPYSGTITAKNIKFFL